MSRSEKGRVIVNYARYTINVVAAGERQREGFEEACREALRIG